MSWLRQTGWVGLLALGLPWWAATGGSVPVTQQTASADLIPYADYFEDPSNTVALAEAMAGPARERFRPAPWKTTPNFSFTRSTHWFRFRVESRASVPTTWCVVVDRPRLDWVGFYVTDGTRVLRSREVGNAIPAAPRDVRVRPFVFTVALEPGAAAEVYMAFRSEAALWIPLTLHAPDDFWEHYLLEELGNLAFFGYMLALTIVAFFMAVAVRDKAYVFYTLTTLTLVGFLFCYKQYPAFFGLPGLLFWGRKGIMLLVTVSSSAFLLYMRHFLDLPAQAPRLDRYMRWVTGVVLVAGLAVQPASYAVISQVVSLLAMCAVAIGFVVSMIFMAQGHRLATFYLAAWAVFLLAVVLRTSALFGWLSVNWVQDSILQWTSMFGYTLFLLALSDRIRQMMRDKLAAQAQLLAAQQAMTHELERQVGERTESLRVAKEEAERARSAMSRFLINTVHDIRAPLNAVFGLAQVLWLESEKLNLPERYCRFLDRVRAGGDALSHMLANLFDLSQIELGRTGLRRDSFTVAEWVEQMRQVVGLVAEHKGVILQWQMSDGARVLNTDRVRLSQVLMNLAHNAIKFTPPGREVRIGLDAQGDRFIMTVDDQGPGISEERRAALWDRDAQLGDERRGEGLGVGLFIVKTNAELLGGVVTVESSPKGGAQFVFRMPLQSAQDEAKPVISDQ